MIAAFIKAFIRLYQLALSPVFGGSCRVEPSCSEYAMEAIDRHGVWDGGKLGTKRLLRCNPFAAAGYDPVPKPRTGGQGHV